MKGLEGVDDVVDEVGCVPGPPHGFGSGLRFSVPRWGFSGVEPDSAWMEKKQINISICDQLLLFKNWLKLRANKMNNKRS